jgi:NAD(P)-dependent dehydrogenase (short-subunit alcohol dehydrogenase family)
MKSMRDLAGKTAFVTGGASGIGFALGKAFVEAKMRVVLADIEAEPLACAVRTLLDLGGEVMGVSCDVSDADSVARAAETAFDTFRHVHMVCNNAGVGDGGGIDNIVLDNWRWVIDVNLMGLVHGVRTFIPHIRAHGEGGHIVNTASMAGLNSGLGFSPYSASKFAVVTMSEGLSSELEPLGIGVTVICPGFVRTRIMESGRNRPERYGSGRMPDPDSPDRKLLVQLIQSNLAGMDPAVVAAKTLAAIQENELYVFTHPDGEWRREVSERFTSILSAMDRAASRSV